MKLVITRKYILDASKRLIKKAIQQKGAEIMTPDELDPKMYPKVVINYLKKNCDKKLLVLKGRWSYHGWLFEFDRIMKKFKNPSRNVIKQMLNEIFDKKLLLTNKRWELGVPSMSEKVFGGRSLVTSYFNVEKYIIRIMYPFDNHSERDILFLNEDGTLYLPEFESIELNYHPEEFIDSIKGDTIIIDSGRTIIKNSKE